MNSSILVSIERRAHSFLSTKYFVSSEQINANTISNIIYNEKLRIVSDFKEWLIFEDQNEFLKRFYNSKESKEKIKNLIMFYEANAKIFPNYCTLPESYYLFKNIKRKQKMIDNLEGFEKERKDLYNSNHSDKTVNIFTSNIINSLMSNSDTNKTNTDTSESFQRIIQIMTENGIENLKIDLNNDKLNKHHKKFIKEIGNNVKVSLKKEDLLSNRKSNNKKVISNSKIVQSSNAGNTKHIQKIGTQKQKEITTIKSKSTSKTKTTLTERSKVKNTNTHNGIKSAQIVISSSIETTHPKTKEAKSMPKLSYKEKLNANNVLNHSTKISKINMRVTNPQTKIVSYNIKTNKTNISTKKVHSDITNNKKIPSLHISFSKPYSSSINKSKSKGKSTSKSPEQSKPNGSGKEKVISPTIGRQTERMIKAKPIKVISTKKQINIAIKNVKSNVKKENTHMKITSSISAYHEDNKTHPKTARVPTVNKKNPVKSKDPNSKRVFSASNNKTKTNKVTNTNILTSRDNSKTKPIKPITNTHTRPKKQIVKKIKNFNMAIKNVSKSTSLSSPYNKNSLTTKKSPHN